MFEKFFPDEYVASTYVIPFEKLYEEGYRGVVFDIDNTLVPHGASADDRAKKLFKRLEDIGFSSCLISNNQEARVKMFNYGDHGDGPDEHDLCGRPAFYGCMGREKSRHTQYSRQTHPLERRDTDRPQEISGEGCTPFL